MTNQFVFTNNAFTTLTSPVTSSSTTFNVASGAAFPNPSSGQQFAIFMTDAATGLVHEVVYATANSANQFTVVRGQEGSTATSWVIGDIVQHVWTAGTIMPVPNGGTGSGTAGGAQENLGTLFNSVATKSSNYNIAYPSDSGKIFTPGTSGVTFTAPSPSATPFYFGVISSGYGCTLAAASGTFYGGAYNFASSITMGNLDFIIVNWDGANWQIMSASSHLSTVHGSQAFGSVGGFSFQAPIGVYQVKARVTGGGGGGGGCNGGSEGGSGGGGGGYGEGWLPVIPGSTYTGAIGAGGTAGGSSSNGGDGGASSFSTITADGGGGGSNNYAQGGAGGSVSGATLGIPGYPGGNPYSVVGGVGGSVYASAGPSPNADTTGNAGQLPGTGGNGCSPNVTGSGGAGAAGLVVIEW